MDSDSGSISSRSSSPDPAADSFFSGHIFLEKCPGQVSGTRGRSKTKGQADLSQEEVQELRLRVNRRERRRMQDLNQAMDGLREVMPYANGPSVRKLSKISTLLLARSYILTLSSSLQEMRRLVEGAYRNAGQGSVPQPPPHAQTHLLHTPLAPPPAPYMGFAAPVLGGSYTHYPMCLHGLSTGK